MCFMSTTINPPAYAIVVAVDVDNSRCVVVQSPGKQIELCSFWLINFLIQHRKVTVHRSDRVQTSTSDRPTQS